MVTGSLVAPLAAVSAGISRIGKPRVNAAPQARYIASTYGAARLVVDRASRMEEIWGHERDAWSLSHASLR
jgi:hypothetical protein